MNATSEAIVGATPKLRRRLMSMLYESIILFAIVAAAGAAGFIFETLTSRYRLPLHAVGQTALFGILGLYFVWFWTHGGQTLPMKTWRIRVTDRGGNPLRLQTAVARYLLLWIFVLPTAALLSIVHVSKSDALIALVVAVFAPTFYALFDRDRQFVHDRLLGTRLVQD